MTQSEQQSEANAGDHLEPNEAVAEDYLLPVWLFEVVATLMAPLEDLGQEPDEKVTAPGEELTPDTAPGRNSC